MSDRRHRIGELAEKAGAWSDPKKGPDGRPQCRWCGKSVAPPRRTFCSDGCVHEWKLRSNPGYVRDLVLRRDRGVCALCKLDTLDLQSRWEVIARANPIVRRFEVYARARGDGDWRTGPHWPVEVGPIMREALRHNIWPRRVESILNGRTPWEADHTVALVEGGSHGLENVRTLCVGCHDLATKKLNRSRR